MEWPRGEATDCKSVYTGSNPVSTSNTDGPLWDRGKTRAIGAVVARFLDTEEVTGSNPVSPTSTFPQVRGTMKPLSQSACRPPCTRQTTLGCTFAAFLLICMAKRLWRWLALVPIALGVWVLLRVIRRAREAAAEPE